MLRNLDKHQKYKKAYKPNDIFWGLGIEHETYIETNNLKQVTVKGLKENKASERYCVNYYNIYTKEEFDTALDGLFKPDEKILLPILLNSHTFQRTDINGEHQTTYERIPKPNPKFNGTTIHNWMKSQNPTAFKGTFEKSYIFDGDTIEFMTQDFYKATINTVINELEEIEADFIIALNALPKEGIFKTYGPFKLAQENYPFASYLTNIKNNAMFNNGTIHLNITLPTKLNDKAEIADMPLFIKQHQNYARAIQWLSSLIVAKYNKYDPLCESSKNGEKYAAGSQRVAVSRYIGLGTYDTDKMEVGKILTTSRDKLSDIDWYEEFHKKVDYKFLNELGMDLNFNKHYCHGLELRLLDSIPTNDIKDILHTLVYLADFSLSNEIENPKKSKLWHRIAENCVHNGKGYFIDVTDQNELYKLFKIEHWAKEPLSVAEVYDLISIHLSREFENSECAKYMIQGIMEEKPIVITDISDIHPIIEPVIAPITNIIPVPEVPKKTKVWCC
jgi:hypothetical protein